MYNILITDDEKIVIESLTFIIEKNFPAQTKIFTSQSGSEALEIASSNKIDIIFMDINMPGLNGLETISRIKHIHPNVLSIILTAFNKFQYAQEAVNLRAFKYLTKPVNRNLIIKTIRNAMNLIDTEKVSLSSDIKIHEQLNTVSPIVESDFIYSCIFCNTTAAELSTYLNYFHINETDTWFMACIEFPHLTKENSYSVYTKVRDILNSESKCITGSFILNRIVVFFSLENCKEKEICSEKIHTIADSVFNKTALTIDSAVRIGISKCDTNIANTSIQYNCAVSALSETPVKGGLVFASDHKTKKDCFKNIQSQAEKILNRLRAGDSGNVHLMTTQYIKNLFKLYGDEKNKTKNALFELLVNARNIVSEINSQFKTDSFISSFSFLSSTDSQKKLERFVQQRMLEYISAISETRAQHENSTIKSTCNYIDTHLSENISLETMAATAKISPYYLSKIFKEEKGENFITYLNSSRLEKARELLSDTRMSIKEISAQTGYKDQNYFSRLFRNKFGMTPTEFRTSITE